jgi:conjugative transfer pilus assembly protein TraH
MLKKIISTSLALAICTHPAHAITMREVFDSANTNITTGGAYSGQAMNYYTGGSLSMRVPNRNYQLASITPPSFRMNSCGSIDAFFGGLSHISAQQFVDMLRRIGTGAVMGFAFKLALSAMSPEIKQAIQELHDLAQKINKMNVDSCEIAAGIVNSTDSAAQGRSALSAASLGEALTNISDGFGAALDRIRSAGPNAGWQVFSSALPTGKITDGNVTWQAINKIPNSFFPGGATTATNYKYLLQSLIGPYIITPKTNADNSSIPSGEVVFDTDAYPAMNYKIADLLWKPTGANQKISLDVYKCTIVGSDDHTKCKTMTQATVEFDSFRSMVHDRMTSITNNIMNKTKPTGTADVAFINSTAIPIYKMLSVATQMKNSHIAYHLIDKYEEAIAAEYAATYLTLALREVQSALSAAAAKAEESSKKAALEQLADRSTEIRRDLSNEMNGIYTKLASINNITMEVMQLERALSNSLPADIQKSLQFQTAMTGGR